MSGHLYCVSAVTEMLVNVLSLKDDDLRDEGDDLIKPGSGTYNVYRYTAFCLMCSVYIWQKSLLAHLSSWCFRCKRGYAYLADSIPWV